MQKQNAKMIMDKIKWDLRKYADEDNPMKKLTDYISENIRKLDTITKKKTTVGVFGKTGAGKSSLINAILGERYLLPSGTLHACTSVIIQVQANITDSNYIAEIEFISKQDWEDELKTLLDVLAEDSEEKDSAIHETANQKIKALYGKKCKSWSIRDLMKDEHFTGIPEFLKSEMKTITCETASDFSKDIECYVRHDDDDDDDDSSPGGSYWPVVKSVTISVPNCKDFLEHVILVDLPGTGDYNKARAEMWRSKLRECSTVWILSESNRAVSEHEAWELVSSSITDMAEGGECSSISFICTKTDVINPQNYMRSSNLQDEDFQITPEDSQYRKKKLIACILHRNKKAKQRVKNKFRQQKKIQMHLNCDDNFLSVFTVSSEHFTDEDSDSILMPEQTEIPALKDLLKKYNNNHKNEVATQYISEALGILYLIQGSKGTDDEMVAQRKILHSDLETNLHNGSECLYDYFRQNNSFLEECLSVAARKSEETCEIIAEEVITPQRDNRGFHQTLTALCKNDGFYRSRMGETDLNQSLAQHMSENIIKTFNEMFLVQGTASKKSLRTYIDKFTIITEELNMKYKKYPVLTHILNFLKIEEQKLKKMLQEEILQRKKKIFASLSESIKTTMKPGYRNANKFSGKGSMLKKQKSLLKHIQSSKREMFQNAKRDILEQMDNIMHFTVKTIKTALMKSMYYSLKENTFADMDVNKEIKELKRLLEQV